MRALQLLEEALLKGKIDKENIRQEKKQLELLRNSWYGDTFFGSYQLELLGNSWYGDRFFDSYQLEIFKKKEKQHLEEIQHLDMLYNNIDVIDGKQVINQLALFHQAQQTPEKLKKFEKILIDLVTKYNKSDNSLTSDNYSLMQMVLLSFAASSLLTLGILSFCFMSYQDVDWLQRALLLWMISSFALTSVLVFTVMIHCCIDIIDIIDDIAEEEKLEVLSGEAVLLEVLDGQNQPADNSIEKRQTVSEKPETKTMFPEDDSSEEDIDKDPVYKKYY